MYTHARNDLVHLAALPPASRNADVETSAVDLADLHAAVAIVQVGAIDDAATLTALWQVSATANFASATDVPGASVSWTGTQDNTVGILTLRGEQASAALATARYARIRLEFGGTGPALCAVEIVGLVERHNPTPDAAGLRGRV